MKKIFFIIIFIFSSKAFANQGSSHPVNKYCLNHAGQILNFNVDNFDGNSIGFCRLPDNSLIEVMTLFKSMSGQTIALNKFLKASWHSYKNLNIEKWAQKNCIDLEGKIINAVEHLRPSVKYQFCEFSDKSIIEIWTLFAGKDHYQILFTINSA